MRMFSSKKKKVLAVFAAIIMAASAVWYVAFPASADNHKVYVCKYVGTPGDDERLQTGQNPIEVSVNAAELTNWDGHSFGVFVDAHDRSFVLGPVPMTPEPTAADCPGPDNPPDDEEIFVPELSETDPCGPDNAVYGEVPPGNYTVTRNDDRSITLVANDGYVFEGGDTTVTLPAPDDVNEPCPPDDEEIFVPELSETDPCGPDNAVYGEVPPGNYTVTRNDDRSITLVANDGYVFEGGDTTVTLPAPDDVNEPCPPGEVGVSGDVSVSSTCESITIGAPSYNPADAEWVIKLNGKSVQPNTYGVKPGKYTVELLVNNESVVAQSVTVKKCASGGNTGGSDLENPTYANTGH